MKPNVSVIDKRTSAFPTFEEIQVGEMFTQLTEFGDIRVFIKMKPCKEMEYDKVFNAITLNGDTVWFNGKEKVKKINNMKVTIM